MRGKRGGGLAFLLGLALAGCGGGGQAGGGSGGTSGTDGGGGATGGNDMGGGATGGAGGQTAALGGNGPSPSGGQTGSDAQDAVNDVVNDGSGPGNDGAGDAAPADLGAALDAAPALTCGTGARTEPAIKGPSAGMTDSDQSFRSLVVSPADADVVFLGSEGNGMFRTRDGGKTWTWLRTGLRYDNFPAYAETWNMAISAARPARIYAAMTDSPGPVTGTWPSARGGVFRSDDSGDSWRQVGCTLPNAKTASVWADPSDADVVIAGLEGGAASFTPPPPLSYYPGGLWKSRDGGETWAPLTLPAGHDHSSYWRITSRGGKLWTFSIDGRETPDRGLGFLSSADGATFTSLAAGFPGKLVTGWDVAPDGTLLASVRDSFYLQRSSDGGASFHRVTGVDAANANGPIAVSADGKVVLFASNNRLHRSEDSLASSSQVLETPGFIEAIEFAAAKPEVIYVASRGLRVHRSADGGKTWTAAGALRADLIEK